MVPKASVEQIGRAQEKVVKQVQQFEPAALKANQPAPTQPTVEGTSCQHRAATAAAATE